jgi:hypothetical protein
MFTLFIPHHHSIILLSKTLISSRRQPFTVQMMVRIQTQVKLVGNRLKLKLVGLQKVRISGQRWTNGLSIEKYGCILTDMAWRGCVKLSLVTL